MNMNKICFSPFPVWLSKYIYSAPGSIDKATLAKSLILQVLVISKELAALKTEDYLEVSSGLEALGPEDSIRLVDEWIENVLPRLEEVVAKSIIETSSARYFFMLMLIVAASVNPRGAIRNFFEKQRSINGI